MALKLCENIASWCFSLGTAVSSTIDLSQSHKFVIISKRKWQLSKFHTIRMNQIVNLNSINHVSHLTIRLSNRSKHFLEKYPSVFPPPLLLFSRRIIIETENTCRGKIQAWTGWHPLPPNSSQTDYLPLYSLHKNTIIIHRCLSLSLLCLLYRVVGVAGSCVPLH